MTEKHDRRYHRKPDTLVVYYRIVNPYSDQVGEELSSASINLSTGGMLLRSTENLAVNTILEVRFKLGPELAEIKLLCSVIRQELSDHPHLQNMALSFTSVSPEERKEIQGYIDAQVS